jgi:hypothetical protein
MRTPRTRRALTFVLLASLGLSQAACTRNQALAAALGLVAVGALAAASEGVDERRLRAEDEVRSRASQELRCPAHAVRVDQASEHEFAAEGCGQIVLLWCNDDFCVKKGS